MKNDELRTEFEALSEIVNYFKMHGDIEHRQYGGYFSGGKPSFYLNGAYFGFRAFKAKLEGCVVVPVEPTEEMYQAYAKHSVAPMSTLSKTGYKAMVEAARGGNE